MIDPFVEKTMKTRNKEGKKFSDGMLEMRSQKASEDENTKLEADVHPNPALDENRAGRGTEGNCNRKLPLESTRVEQGHNFATPIRILD